MASTKSIELLDVCRLILKHESDASELPSAISSTRQNLETLKQNFLKRLDEDGEGARKENRLEIDETLSAMDAYAAGIDEIERFLKDNADGTLVQGMDKVRRAINRVGAAMYRYEVGILAKMGPTQDPAYNLIDKMVNDYREKRVTKERLQKSIESVFLSAEQSMQAMNSSAAIPAVQEMMKAYENHQEALKAILEALNLNDAGLDEALKAFRETCENLRERQVHAQVKVFVDGPTPSKTANFMINLCNELRLGQVDPKLFAYGMKLLEAELHYFQETIKRLPVHPPEAAEALQAYQEAIAHFSIYEKTRDPHELVKGPTLLRKAVSQLFALLNPQSPEEIR